MQGPEDSPLPRRRLRHGFAGDSQALRALHFRESEIQDFDSRFRYQHIRRFQIAVRNALAVRRVHRMGQLDGERERPIERHRAFEG